MSIVVLKKKSLRFQNTISGKEKDGFSLVGGHRNIGSVGPTNLAKSVTRTTLLNFRADTLPGRPFQAVHVHPDADRLADQMGFGNRPYIAAVAAVVPIVAHDEIASFGHDVRPVGHRVRRPGDQDRVLALAQRLDETRDAVQAGFR